MLKHRLFAFGAGLVTVAALSLGAGSALAQHGGHGGGGGGGHGGGGGGHGGGGWGGGGWGGGGHGGGWHGGDWGGWYGRGWGGYYGGYGWGYPYNYYYYPRYYGYGWYNQGYPYYGWYEPDYDYGDNYNYGMYGAPATDNSVHIRVIAPPDAQIWFGNNLTTQTGPERYFDSPQLEPGQNYVYEIRAQWRENGREVSQTRQVTVHAGESITVDFTRPIPSGS